MHWLNVPVLCFVFGLMMAQWAETCRRIFNTDYQYIFKNKSASRKPKLKVYWSVIRPVVVHGCETWVLKESIIQRLSVFERKILLDQLKKIMVTGESKQNIALGHSVSAHIIGSHTVYRIILTLKIMFYTISRCI